MTNPASGSIRLFVVFGIEVFIHWTWFLVGYLLWAYSGLELSAFLSIYLSLFGIVLLHEFGHALACRSVGGTANRIVLWPLGGIAFVRPPHRPLPMLWSIAAGPLVNVVLVPVFLVLHIIFVGAATENFTTVQQYIMALNYINLLLLIFNMLPIYPLDGGQILQSILWFFLGYARSLRVAAVVGLIVAAAAVVPLLLMQEWWLFILAIFIGLQAYNGLRYATMLARAEAEQNHAPPWIEMPPR